MSNFEMGDHLVAQRLGYTHHGIYVGNGVIIHYLAEGVTTATEDEFAAGERVWVEDHFLRFDDRETAVGRAFDRIGDDNYNVIFNNCEHFVHWCITGLHRSPQVEDAAVTVVASGVVASRVIGAKTVTSVLSGIGAGAGTSAVMGTTAVATTSGIMGVAAMGTVATAATVAAPLVVGVAAAAFVWNWFSD